MSVWNVFDPNAFSLQSLTAAINEVPYTPTLITKLGLFSEEPITTTTALVEENNGTLSLVDVQPRNASGKVVNQDKRNVRSFTIPHLPQRAAVMADSVQGIRAFGQESTAQSVETMRNARLEKMRRQLDYTNESHRVSVIKGTYIDAQGASISLFTAFGVTQQTVNFVLGTATTKIRSKCLDVISKIEDALGGIPFDGIHCFCGTSFWDDLITHAKVEETYLNTQMAGALREDPRQVMDFGGIRFERYRGTSAVKIPDAEAYAFPTGVPEFFTTYFAPANYIETVNSPGLPYYAKSQVMDFDKGLELESQSNPLNLCTRPAAVIKLTAA